MDSVCYLAPAPCQALCCAPYMCHLLNPHNHPLGKTLLLPPTSRMRELNLRESKKLAKVTEWVGDSETRPRFHWLGTQVLPTTASCPDTEEHCPVPSFLPLPCVCSRGLPCWNASSASEDLSQTPFVFFHCNVRWKIWEWTGKLKPDSIPQLIPFIYNAAWIVLLVFLHNACDTWVNF